MSNGKEELNWTCLTEEEFTLLVRLDNVCSFLGFLFFSYCPILVWCHLVVVEYLVLRFRSNMCWFHSDEMKHCWQPVCAKLMVQDKERRDYQKCAVWFVHLSTVVMSTSNIVNVITVFTILPSTSRQKFALSSYLLDILSKLAGNAHCSF